MDRVARRGPLAQAHGTPSAERGTLPKLSTFLSQLKGFCRKTSKIERGKNFYFRKKISQWRKKTERGDPLGFSNIHSVAKQQKN